MPLFPPPSCERRWRRRAKENRPQVQCPLRPPQRRDTGSSAILRQRVLSTETSQETHTAFGTHTGWWKGWCGRKYRCKVSLGLGAGSDGGVGTLVMVVFAMQIVMLVSMMVMVVLVLMLVMVALASLQTLLHLVSHPHPTTSDLHQLNRWWQLSFKMSILETFQKEVTLSLAGE